MDVKDSPRIAVKDVVADLLAGREFTDAAARARAVNAVTQRVRSFISKGTVVVNIEAHDEYINAQAARVEKLLELIGLSRQESEETTARAVAYAMQHGGAPEVVALNIRRLALQLGQELASGSGPRKTLGRVPEPRAEWAAGGSLNAAAYKSLQQLPYSGRMAILLRFFDQRSEEEMAEVMEMSRKKAHALLGRSLSELGTIAGGRNQVAKMLMISRLDES